MTVEGAPITSALGGTSVAPVTPTLSRKKSEGGCLETATDVYPAARERERESRLPGKIGAISVANSEQAAGTARSVPRRGGAGVCSIATPFVSSAATTVTSPLLSEAVLQRRGAERHMQLAAFFGAVHPISWPPRCS